MSLQLPRPPLGTRHRQSTGKTPTATHTAPPTAATPLTARKRRTRYPQGASTRPHNSLPCPSTRPRNTLLGPLTRSHGTPTGPQSCEEHKRIRPAATREHPGTSMAASPSPHWSLLRHPSMCFHVGNRTLRGTTSPPLTSHQREHAPPRLLHLYYISRTTPRPTALANREPQKRSHKGCYPPLA